MVPLANPGAMELKMLVDGEPVVTEIDGHEVRLVVELVIGSPLRVVVDHHDDRTRRGGGDGRALGHLEVPRVPGFAGVTVGASGTLAETTRSV